MADSQRRIGPRHLVLTAYAVFVLAAGGRSIEQLSVAPHRALLAYVLSAVSAFIYAVGLVLLAGARRSPRARTLAVAWCGIEFAGVLAVGTFALLAPGHFPEPTVWSGYGSGYGWVPLALPLLAWLWIHRSPDYRFAAQQRRPDPVAQAAGAEFPE